MKKIVFLLFSFVLCAQWAEAQEASVEKSVIGVQIGYPGIWAYQEAKLGDRFSLRTEVGLFSGYVSSGVYGQAGLISVPEITLEPRWYYNLSKRSRASKRTAGNAGNFLALKLSYYPDWFIVSSLEHLTAVNHVAVIPKWGIRRSIGKHFDFEAGIGIGVRRVFFEHANSGNDKTVAAGDLHLRFGYHF